VSLKKLGRYDLVRVLGKGAMGIVYEGRDPNLDRRVAIKTVKVENLSEEAATEYDARFRTEARSAARLQHPNIVSVYDSDRDGDNAFLVMEYIQGDDLKHHLDQGVRYSLEQSLKMIRDLLSALDYAHKQGIIHRDVKPANLLIEPGGRVKLTDFGVARIQNSGEATRTQGSMVGTLKYMSPEQVQGQKIDARADLFSVGVVLYQLLTDKRPFDGDNDFSIIHQIIGHTPPPPSSYNARLPSAIDAVVARALAKDREERFASARDFASALQSAIRRAEDATVVPPADPFKKRDPGGTGSRGHRSAGSVPTGSTVTQEIELVYWKDIKDSNDREVLEGFLAKFPAGIYADLAQRRLRKLSGGNGLPDQTVLSGADTIPGEQDLEATRLRSGTTPPEAAAAAAADATLPPAPMETTQPIAPRPVEASIPAGATATAATLPLVDFTSTVVDLHDLEPLDPQRQAAAFPGSDAQRVPTVSTSVDNAAPAAAAEPAPQPWIISGEDPPPRRRRILVTALAAMAALAAVGFAAMMMMDRGGSVATAVAPASAPVAAASGVVVAAAIVPTVGAPPPPELPLSAPAPKPAAAPIKAPTSTRSAANAAKSQVVVTPVETHPEEPPAPRREERRTVAVAPSTAIAPSPAEACRDKIFLSKEFCLAEQCDKPGARNHPLCVKRREEAKLREDSKIRN
jgi:eukaryotic-like serine/threonine-protein kinase